MVCRTGLRSSCKNDGIRHESRGSIRIGTDLAILAFQQLDQDVAMDYFQGQTQVLGALAFSHREPMVEIELEQLVESAFRLAAGELQFFGARILQSGVQLVVSIDLVDLSDGRAIFLVELWQLAIQGAEELVDGAVEVPLCMGTAIVFRGARLSGLSMFCHTMLLQGRGRGGEASVMSSVVDPGLRRKQLLERLENFLVAPLL